jgi:hypothetical protein
MEIMDLMKELLYKIDFEMTGIQPLPHMHYNETITKIEPYNQSVPRNQHNDFVDKVKIH